MSKISEERRKPQIVTHINNIAAKFFFKNKYWITYLNKYFFNI